MNLKNYTSSVSAFQTIAYIEAYLAEAGVTGIGKEYGPDKQPSAIMFSIQDGTKKFSVRLPVNIAAVTEFLFQDYVRTHARPKKTKEDFREQAVRTAWKIQQDWVQVQMSLIKLKQAQPVEVFMPYLWDGQQTVYQRALSTGFKMLPETT